MNYIKRATIGYLAGLFDGEGCITVAKYNRKNRQGINNYYALRLTLTNKNRPCLELFRDTFRIGGINQDKRSSCWVWASGGTSHNKKILKALLPHLIIRRAKAKLAIRLSPQELYRENQEKKI